MKTLLSTLLFAVASLAASQVDPNRVVFSVNGEEVKGSEYYRRMEYLPGVGRRSNDTFAEFPPGFLTIEQMITERLVLQLAKQKGVAPTDAEVLAEIQNAIADDPAYLQSWTDSGRSRAELDYQVRFDLAQFKLLTFGITVTDQQVEQFYKENPTTFSLPKRVKLRVIVVGTEAEQAAVDKDLAAGKKFSEVASARSLDISKAIGGDFGVSPYDQLAPTAKDAIDKRKADGTTVWVNTGEKYVKFLVEQVLPEEKIPLDAKTKRRIRRKRMADIGAVKNDIQKEMNAMRLKAKIDIKQKEFADAYKKFTETFLKGG